jgi:hypothetical protein
LASTDHRLGRVESELTALRSEIKSRFAVLTWAVDINAAATIAILGPCFAGSSESVELPQIFEGQLYFVDLDLTAPQTCSPSPIRS